MAEKLDLKKEYPDYYKAKAEVQEVKLGPAHFLTLDGHGAPGDASFQHAFGTLYAVAYDLKFAAKERDADFVVPPPEALYNCVDDQNELLPKEDWKWQVLVRMPPGTTKAQVEHSKDRVGKKRGDLPVMNVNFSKLHVGRAVQALHVGPYEEIKDTVANLFAYINENGLTADGLYHEVYLNDPGRTAPEKLKTIVRQPVK